MTATKLSLEMEKCLESIQNHGKLIRFKGGFWCNEDVEMQTFQGHTFPVSYYNWGTIKALLDRDLIEATVHKEGYKGRGKYAVEVKLKTL